MNGATTREFDYGFVRIMKELKKLEGKPHVKVGFQGAEGNKPHEDSRGSLTVAEVAVYNEFGTSDGRIPERPFMRSTYDTKRDEWTVLTDKFAADIYTGHKNVEQALDLLGHQIVKDIQARIRSSPEWAVANAESTYLRKLAKTATGIADVGSVKPLIDTGQMLNSVTYVKVMKGGDATINEGVEVN